MDVWRSGNYVIIHRLTRFPDRCIVTGEPAYRTVWQLISCTCFPESVQIILKTLLAVPGIGILTLPIVYLFQHHIIIKVPLSQSEYFRYRKKIWHVWQGAFIAEVIGFVLVKLTVIELTIGLIGFAIMCSTPLLMLLLLLDRIWIIGLYKIENDFRWIQIREGGGPFLSHLPSWEEKLRRDEAWQNSCVESPKKIWSLPADWNDRIPPRLIGLIFTSLGGLLTYESIRFHLINSPISKSHLNHYFMLGLIVLQVGLAYLLGGKNLVQHLFRSRTEVTILGKIFLILIGLISVLITIWFSFQ